MSRFFVWAVAAAAVVTLASPPPASAVTYDKLAYMTFSAPVQVPGVTLNAGTYRFHLTNPDTGRSVLQVLSNDGWTVYAMFLTRPDSRTSLTDEPVVTFMETPAGVPPAIRSLFYGGEYRGYEFVYPKGGPNRIAEEHPQPPIRYTFHPEAPLGKAFLEPEAATPIAPQPVPEPAGLMAQAAPPAVAPVELPRTATPLPLIALGGFSSLLAGLGLGRLRRRSG